MEKTFTFMADLIRSWLAGARIEEVVETLDLVAEELQRRGVTLTWSTAPPVK